MRAIQNHRMRNATINGEQKMKTKTSILVMAATLFLMPEAAIRIVAQQQNLQHDHYKLIDVSTLGGPQSFFSAPLFPVNSRGRATSCSETSTLDGNYPNINAIWFGDPYVNHAFLWDGQLHDLSTLPGGTNSCGQSINPGGQVIGYSENGESDPLLGAPAVHATLWQPGQITDLGTFGGYESVAYSINDRGMAVGGASNAVPDPYTNNYSNFFIQAATQVHAFTWKDGGLQDLGTLGTGTDSFAFYVNERGQVAGQSFTDTNVNATTGMPTMHPFLWEKGKMKDLGTIGGTFVNFISGMNAKGQVAGSMNVAGDASFHPFLWDGQALKDLGTFGGAYGQAFGINNAGEVIGAADPPGDSTQYAFLWKRGVLINLGTLPGDVSSFAQGINASGQIVGWSQDSRGNLRAFLRETDGSMFNLQDLIVSGPSLSLNEAVFIGDNGEIALDAFTSNGDKHAVLLVPCGESEDGCGDVAGAAGAPFAPAVRESSGQMTPARSGRRMNRGRLGLPTGPRN